MDTLAIIKSMQELKDQGCLDESQIYSGGNSMDSQRYYNAKPAGLVKENNQDVVVKFSKGIRGRHGFKAYKNDKLVAYGEVQKDKIYDDLDNGASVQDIVVSEKYRRQGIASKVYDEIERQLNYKLHPSDDLTDMGRKFWVSRKSNIDEDYTEDNDIIYYFAYGMLTDPSYMENADLVGVGKLSNYKLTLYTYANVEPDSDNDTYGCLWAIDKNLLKNLDEIEGYPQLYKRELHDITCRGRTYKAEVYVMTRNTLHRVQDTVPSQGYIDTIVTGYRHAKVPLDQLRVAVDEVNERYLSEASPDTLGGSFTEDLIASKSWLGEKLSKGLKGKNAGTIYIIGSWYGNMAIYLQQYGIKFDKLVFIDIDEDKLQASKKLLEPLYDEGKLILLNQNADDVVYDKPGIVINTSCNETGPVFLTKLPDDMLVVLQARNNKTKELTATDSLEELIEYFPLKKVYYSGEKQLNDPETEYSRYMVIGRSGKKLDETVSTGLGGGSAGNVGGSMVGGPETYEQENDKFKSRGQRRIRVNFESKEVVNELFDRGYNYQEKRVTEFLTVYNFKTDKGRPYKIRIFQGPNSNTIGVDFSTEYEVGILGSRDEFKVMATVVNVIINYLKTHDVDMVKFSGASDEPSRIKLYTAMAKQLTARLPEYEFADTIKTRDMTTFYIKRKKSNIQETVDGKITLNQLYRDSYPEHDESIWNYVGTNDFDIPFTVETITPNKLSLLLTSQYHIEHIDELFDMMDEDQEEIVRHYMKEPNLSDEVLVMADGRIIDGHHRALAAVLTKRPIKYVDIAEDMLNEINGAHDIGKLNWDPSYKDRCEVVGQVEGFDIYCMPIGNNKMFMFLDDDDNLLAYIVVGYSEKFPDRMSLRRIENLSGRGGLATTLALGIKDMGGRFVIDADEPITISGLKWATSLIQKKFAAFKVTDQDGNMIDPEQLTKEREDAIFNRRSGSTSVLIEFSEEVRNTLLRNNKEWLKEGIDGLLKPHYIFLGAGYLL